MLAELKSNPGLITKVLEIFQNPSAIVKHLGDPGVQKLMSKFGSKFGGGGFPGGAQGFPGPQAGKGSSNFFKDHFLIKQKFRFFFIGTTESSRAGSGLIL